MKGIIIGLALLMLGGGCAGRPKVATLPFDAFPAEQWAICEAVFRHLFSGDYSARQKDPASRWCLAIAHGGWSEPAPTFLARFSDLGGRVRGQSAFRPGRDVSFTITSLERKAPDLYRVMAGCYSSPIGSYSAVFRVRLEGGNWSVQPWPGEVQLISGKSSPAPATATRIGSS